jgi:hypothetical protein
VRRELAAVLAILALLLSPAAALAARRLAIIGLSAEGASGDVRDQFEAAIEEGLRKVGYEVVTRSAALDVVTSRELPEGCVFGPCVEPIGRALRVDRFLYARIGADGQAYSFVLTLVETRLGTSVGQVVGSCPVCTVAEAVDQVRGSIDVLEGRAGSPSPLVARTDARRPPRRVAPLVLGASGLAATVVGALLVSRTTHDSPGWVTIGSGGTALLTGLIWAIAGD